MENNTNTEVMPEGTGAPAEINTAAQDNANVETVAAVPESNPAVESAQPAELTYYAKLKLFKEILEDFVCYLEFIIDEDATLKRYANFIENASLPEAGKIKICHRYVNRFEDGKIKKIVDLLWERFGSNDSVSLVLNTRGKKPNVAPRGCYLHWTGTGYNIKAIFTNDCVLSLYICECREKFRKNGEKFYEDINHEMFTSIDELGLFRNEPPNEKLKQFWKKFEEKILSHNADLVAQETVKMINNLQDIITNNKNLILTGAPGTGKTYLAKQLACKLVGAKKADPKEDEQYKNHVKFVQFHPSYDYTDFVEGLRPLKTEAKDGQLGFERKDGTFKELCKAALKAPTENFVMIIDEINRGQVSKIFGELFFALDPDYRGEEGRVETQYQNMVPDDDPFIKGFYVPENVYVIGTMNDIDHSLEPLDFAFRRRFAWREITAEERFMGMFKGDEPFSHAPDEFVNKVKLYFDNLNEAIGKDSGLGSEYQVGPAYFLKLKNFVGKQDLNSANNDQINAWMEQLWKFHLKPLLVEYLKGNSDTSLDIKKLHDDYLSTKPKQGTNQSGEQAGGAQG